MILGSVISFCFHVFLSVFTRFFRKGNKSERPMPHSAGYFRRAGPRTPFHLQRRPLPVIAFSENGSTEGLKSGRKSCKSGRNPHFCTGNINFNKERHESNIDEGRFRGGQSAGNGLPCRRTRPGRPDSLVGEGLPAAGAETLDCTGLVVTAGFVDAHVHIRSRAWYSPPPSEKRYCRTVPHA